MKDYTFPKNPGVSKKRETEKGRFYCDPKNISAPFFFILLQYKLFCTLLT